MTLLIDADIVTFRAAFTAEDEEEAWIACSRADAMIEEMCTILGDKDVELWLSGPDNFRYGVFPEYKANRITAKRPRWEKEVKEYFTTHWAANWSQGCEADDMLGVRQMELTPKFGDEWIKREGQTTIPSIICSIDKDLNQIPGWHYNFVKKEKYFVTPEEAIRFFYYQCLVGDTADGIKGVPGIGPKKAERILDQAYEKEDDQDLARKFYSLVVDQYSSYEEFLMNAQVLHIWQKPGDIWSDPYKEEDWTPARKKAFIVAVLRNGSRRWPPKYETLNEAKTEKKTNPASGRLAQHFKCKKCRKDFPAKMVQVDHIKPVVDPTAGFVDWNTFIERLFCDKGKSTSPLQSLPRH